MLCLVFSLGLMSNKKNEALSNMLMFDWLAVAGRLVWQKLLRFNMKHSSQTFQQNSL